MKPNSRAEALELLGMRPERKEQEPAPPGDAGPNSGPTASVRDIAERHLERDQQSKSPAFTLHVSLARALPRESREISLN